MSAPRLTRRQLAEFLTAKGFPISLSYLEKRCAPAVGDGPPVDAWWGNRPLYDPDKGLAWAEARLRPARATSTAAA